MFNHPRLMTAAAGLAATALLAGCSASGTADSGDGESGPIKIGMIVAKTGPYSSSNVPFADGVDAAIQDANANGGVGGRDIDLMVKDEKSDPRVGLLAYQQLVDRDKVVGLVGSLNSSDLQQTVLPRLLQDKIASVGSFSTVKEATSTGNPYFFAMQPSYADQADIAIASAAKASGKSKPRVATLYLPISSGEEWKALVKERVEKLGGVDVGMFPLETTATDADSQVQKIVKAKPDFIALHGSPTTAVVVGKSLRKFDAKIPVTGIYAIGPRSTYDALPKEFGSLISYVSSYTPASIDAPGTADLKAAADKYGYAKEVSDANYVNGWVVGRTLVEGLKKAGDTVDRASVVKGMEQLTNFDTGGLSPNVTFGPQKRAGIQVNRPYTWDYDAEKFVATGTYDEWRDDLSNEYLPADQQ